MDRGAACLLPGDFVAPLEVEVAGDLEGPLWVDALGLIALTALIRNASNWLCSPLMMTPFSRFVRLRSSICP